jgi:hypothetical protein
LGAEIIDFGIRMFNFGFLTVVSLKRATPLEFRVSDLEFKV